jgi:phosphoenolpyruvate carboxykinase (ATP)
VNDALREKELGWGEINMRISNDSFKALESQALTYLNNKKRLYVVDGYAGWDKNDRIKIRIVATRAYHALFMTNMLVRPTVEEL